MNVLKIKNYKCYEEETFELSRFNVFSGYNSGGKSSLIDTIILLNKVHNKNLNTVYLNDIRREYNFNSLAYINRSSKNSDFFEITLNDNIYKFSLDIDFKTSLSEFNVYQSNNENLVYNNIILLPASRYYNDRSVLAESINVYSSSGLSSHLQIKEQSDPENFRIFVEAVKEVFESDIEIETISHSYTSNKSFTILMDKIPLDLCGYGIRVNLILIYMCVFSKNKTIIIENPEIHLHPSAQSRLMKKLFEISKINNNYLFIESHSDHILLSPSLAVSDNLNSVEKEDFSIYHFSRSNVYNIRFSETSSHLEGLPQDLF